MSFSHITTPWCRTFLAVILVLFFTVFAAEAAEIRLITTDPRGMNDPAQPNGPAEVPVDKVFSFLFQVTDGYLTGGPNLHQVGIRNTATGAAVSCRAGWQDQGILTVEPLQPLDCDAAYVVEIPENAIIRPADGASFPPAGSGTVYQYPFRTQSRPAAQPVNLKGRVLSKGTVEWTWDYSGSTGNGFKIYAGHREVQTIYGTGTLRWVESGLADGEHTRTVAAFQKTADREIPGPMSAPATVTVESLGKPGNFKGEKQGSGEVLWTWDDNAYAETGYKLYDDQDNLIARLPANATSYLETGLAPDVYHHRYIVAYLAATGNEPAREGPRSDRDEVRTDYYPDRDSWSRRAGGDRSRIADAVYAAVQYAISPSDVVVVENIERNDDASYQVWTENNRCVAFTYQALKNTETVVRITTSATELRVPSRWLRRNNEGEGSAVLLREYIDNTLPPAGKVRVSPAYAFDLVRYSSYSKNGYEANAFNDDDPVQLTIYYDAWNISNPASLKVYRRDSGTWRQIPGSVDTISRCVRARVTEFGVFALFENATGQTTPVPGQDFSLPPGYVSGGGYPNYSGGYTAAPFFADLLGHWARGVVESMAARGLVNGTAPGIFDPDKATTRAEFITLLLRAVGGADAAPAGVLPFSDVRADDWFGGSIRQALQKGLINAGGTFRPYAPVTRQEMAAWTGRALIGRSYYTTGPVPEHFPDWPAVEPSLREDAGRLVRAGVMQGRPDGCFDPGGAATRAETAALINNFLERVR
ncbi:MAG: S-layer homology domain-containing protein [Heliobacteriaceae bacterium]|nr:S-layer homology domain-containing protein [Heliobacteriaceae bacterium]